MAYEAAQAKAKADGVEVQVENPLNTHVHESDRHEYHGKRWGDTRSQAEKERDSHNQAMGHHATEETAQPKKVQSTFGTTLRQSMEQEKKEDKVNRAAEKANFLRQSMEKKQAPVKTKRWTGPPAVNKKSVVKDAAGNKSPRASRSAHAMHQYHGK